MRKTVNDDALNFTAGAILMALPTSLAEPFIDIILLDILSFEGFCHIHMHIIVSWGNKSALKSNFLLIRSCIC
jgi:hypothetical protein